MPVASATAPSAPPPIAGAELPPPLAAARRARWAAAGDDAASRLARATAPAGPPTPTGPSPRVPAIGVPGAVVAVGPAAVPDFALAVALARFELDDAVD